MIALASEPVKNHIVGEIPNPKHQILNNIKTQKIKMTTQNAKTEKAQMPKPIYKNPNVKVRIANEIPMLKCQN
jgi:hypothetical protein